MVVAYLHLIRLEPSATDVAQFSRQIRQHGPSYRYTVAVFAQARFHVAQAQTVDRDILTGQWLPTPTGGESWDCYALLVPDTGSSSSSDKGGSGVSNGGGGATLPNSLAHAVARSYTLKCAVGGAMLRDLARRNAELHAGAALDGAAFNDAHLQRLRERTLQNSSQALEASPELLDRARGLLATYGAKPVTMLNLLRFNDAEPGLKSYQEYGRRFRAVGGARGGFPKIVGKVLQPAWIDGRPTAGTRQDRWDELAIVHYPNIVAFCDMAAGDDYQKINQQYRLPALKDTLLLCGREIPLAAEPGSSKPPTSEADLSGKL